MFYFIWCRTSLYLIYSKFFTYLSVISSYSGYMTCPWKGLIQILVYPFSTCTPCKCITGKEGRWSRQSMQIKVWQFSSCNTSMTKTKEIYWMPYWVILTDKKWCDGEWTQTVVMPLVQRIPDIFDVIFSFIQLFDVHLY